VLTKSSLDDTFTLAAPVVDAFSRDGHALVRGLASPSEASAFLPLVEAASIATARNKHEMKKPGNTDGVFLQAFNLWRVDDRIAPFVLSRRFADVAARLLGVERVRLYHDQSLCKGAGVGRTPWHQDHYYWPLDTDQMITMWMPLVDVPESMTFASGSHTLGDLGGTGINNASSAAFAAAIAERGIPTASYGAMTAGDATFHGGWTLHSAGRNASDKLRTVMTVIYYADGARVARGLTPAQEVDRRAWLGGRAPGELADHAVNVVI
jgi:ectoine hydroxylase-related dioxygenase (phytanoyl-CoA dioxygenase family)